MCVHCLCGMDDVIWVYSIDTSCQLSINWKLSMSIDWKLSMLSKGYTKNNEAEQRKLDPSEDSIQETRNCEHDTSFYVSYDSKLKNKTASSITRNARSTERKYHYYIYISAPSESKVRERGYLAHYERILAAV
jgi:hypothetical protein